MGRDPGVIPAASVQLRVFGGLELRLNGTEVRAILAQPKRLALFLYLTLERSDFHRREALLALFWPESSDGAARASLRQALRFLRLSLGEEVIVNRGDAEIGLAPGMLHCDAIEFGRRLATGDDAGGLALYRGDLLPGLNVGESPDLEQWLDWQRLRYRQQALQAALRLVDATEHIDAPAAVEWARRAFVMEPTDEGVAARLMGLLDRTGNRAAAIAVYDQLTRRLHDAYELMPSPETVALLAAMRARTAANEGDPPDDHSAHEVGADRTRDGFRHLNRARVFVAVFVNATGDPSLDVLGTMTTDWLSQGLASVPELEIVPPMFAMSSTKWGGDGGAPADHDRALADEAGAGTLVSGTYYVDGDRLRFHARIVDTAAGRVVRSPEPVMGPTAAPFEAIKLLGQRLTAVLAPMLTPRSIHVQRSLPPPSYEAYRAYMEGLERFINGDWRGALPHFDHAAAANAEYALPQLVSAIAHWNLGELPEAMSLAREATHRRSSMGPFEHEIHNMILAWLAGDWVAAHRAASRQAELAPGSIPHFSVAQEARRLNRPQEAVDVLTQLEPERGELRGWFFFWLELPIARHLLGDHAGELEAASRACDAYPGHSGVDLLMARALAALGQVEPLNRLIDAALTSPRQSEPRAGLLLRDAGLTLLAHGHAEAAKAYFERSLRWWQVRPADEAASVASRRALACALFHAGLWDEAGRAFRALIDEDAPDIAPATLEHVYLQGNLDEGYLAVIAVQRGDELEVARWCTALKELRRPFLFGGQWRWLAAVAALRGEQTEAVAHLRRAFAEGLPMEMAVHHDPHLGLLRGYAPFDARMEPLGSDRTAGGQ